MKFKIRYVDNVIMSFNDMKKHIKKSYNCDFYDIGFFNNYIHNLHKEKFEEELIRNNNIIFRDLSHFLYMDFDKDKELGSHFKSKLKYLKKTRKRRGIFYQSLPELIKREPRLKIFINKRTKLRKYLQKK